MSTCVFCEIVAKRMDPELTVFENAHVIAQIALHQKPRNQGHILVLPKQHIQDIYGLSEELDGPLMSAIRLMSCMTKQAFSADGIHIRQNNETASGQDVFHLHFHVIPRYDGDDFDMQAYERLPVQKRKAQAEKMKLAFSR